MPGRCLRRDLRQWRFLVHGGDGAVKLEILGLLGKASCFQQPGEAAVLPDQRRGTQRADARRARQSVGRIAAQRDEIRHLLGRDAVALTHLLRPDARHLAGLYRVEDRGFFRSELEGVAVAAGDEHGPAASLLCDRRRGEKIVGLVAGAPSIGEPAGGDKFRNQFKLLD